MTYEPTVALRFVDARLFDGEVRTSAPSAVDILLVDMDTLIRYQNNLSRMSLPLLITAERADYEVTLDNVAVPFSIVYTLSEELDLDNRMLIRALDIELTDHPFDSLEYACGLSGCIDKQTQIICYY